MSVVGIEVIRRNRAVEAVAGEKIELTYGDTLRVTTAFDFRGPAGRATLYGAIGNRGAIGFDEILVGEASIELPESPAEFTPFQRSVDISITSNISPGTDYDLYCKIKETPEAGLPEVNDVIDIVGMPPTFQLIQETIYPYSYIYEGPAETCTFEFKLLPEQIPTYPWLGQPIVDNFVSELKKEGAKLLDLRVYEDTTPTFWTNYRVEVTATASPLPWNLIILGVLAILFIVAIIFLIEKIDELLFKRRPELKDVKPGWGKETLILAIRDSEEFWERTPTPVETLGGMSEAELREYLDTIAEEEVPPPDVSWVPLAIIGAAGVLGVGALALVTRRKE